MTSAALKSFGADGVSRTTTSTDTVFAPALFSSESEYFPLWFLKIDHVVVKFKNDNNAKVDDTNKTTMLFVPEGTVLIVSSKRPLAMLHGHVIRHIL